MFTAPDLCPGTIYGKHYPGILDPHICGACDKVIASSAGITIADLVAARTLTGGVTTNSLVADLPGADRCPHSLTGAGTNIHDTSEIVQRQWAPNPYRHHDYVSGLLLRKEDGIPYCKCGGNPSDAIHARCDLEGE